MSGAFRPFVRPVGAGSVYSSPNGRSMASNHQQQPPPLSSSTATANTFSPLGSTFMDVTSPTLTLNTHMIKDWPHDLMIDSRLFDSLAIGDIIEIRKVENAGRATRSESQMNSSEPITLAASFGGPKSHIHYDSDEESDGSYDDDSLVDDEFTFQPPSLSSPTEELDSEPLLLEVTTTDPPLGRVQVSIARQLADDLNFLRYSPVKITKLSSASAAKYEAVFVEISFRGRYLTNGDLWLVRSALRGKPVYVGKIIKILGVKMKVEQIHHASTDGGVDEKKKARCGVVSNRTRLVFRCGSAHVFWLIQCSVEMWNFADDGDLLHERLFYKFIPEILSRWNASSAKHALTVVFFTRTVFNGEYSTGLPCMNRFPNPSDNRRYVDFYHVAMSNVTKTDWNTLIGPLQAEFHAFAKKANWASKTSANSSICGLPSHAQEGNVLEAINIALNDMQNQHVDRDLLRSGQLIVLMTPGSGVFEVDYRLTRLTRERMTNHAVGCDVISLTQPPSHVVPLFIHNPCPTGLRNQHSSTYEFDKPHPFCDVFRASMESTSSSTTSPTFVPSSSSSGSPNRATSTSDGTGSSPHQHKSRLPKIPVFNIPYWLNLSFPFHRSSSKEFQPIFENRMFHIPDPQRSCFPSALLAPLESLSMKVPIDLEFSTSVATWATTRRLPTRAEVRPWYPLVFELVSHSNPRSNAPSTAPSPRLVASSRSTSPSRRPMMFRPSKPSVAHTLMKSSSILNSNTPPPSSTPLLGPLGTIYSDFQQLPPFAQQSRQQGQLEPSPSLVALQSFAGGDRGFSTQPRVSWIQESFALPPSSQSGNPPLRSKTFSMLHSGSISQFLNQSNGSTTNSNTSMPFPASIFSQQHRNSIQQLGQGTFDVTDEDYIRVKQKRHDAQVFSPNAVAPVPALVRSRSNPNSTMSPSVFVTKQSVNDLATLAMTPSMTQKPRQTSGLSRPRRGASESAEGSSLPKPLRIERSLSMNSSRSYMQSETLDSSSANVERQQGEMESSSQSSSSTYFSDIRPTAPPTTQGLVGPYVNPFQMESLTRWYCERPSHSRSRWLHLFPTSRLDLRYMDLDLDEDESQIGGGGNVVMSQFRKRAHAASVGFLDERPIDLDEFDDLDTEGGEDEPPRTPAPSPSSAMKQTSAKSSKWGGDVNWKSLQTPAILPLTTGFAPSSDALAQSYSFGTYSLVGHNMEQLLQDVICQRLSEDFQIYDPEDFEQQHDQAILFSNRFSDTNHGLTPSPSSTSSTGHTENFILTIGHHVHVLSFSHRMKKLDVTLFGNDQQLLPYEYRYMLWDAEFTEAVPVFRHFVDESASEYNWNYVDNLLMGESIDDLPGSESFFRFKRLSYCIFDETSIINLKKFLMSKVPDITENHPVQLLGEVSDVANPFDCVIDMSTSIELNLPAQENVSRPREWLYLNFDEQYHKKRSFHFQVRWMVASGDSILRFLDELQAAKVNIIQIANHCLSFDNHPLVVPRRVKIDRDKGRSTEWLGEVLVSSGLFVFDSSRIATKSSKTESIFIRVLDPVGSVFCRVQDAVDAGLCLDFLVNPFAGCSDFPEFIKRTSDLFS